MVYFLANMNRAFGMLYKTFFVSAVCLSMVACQPHGSPSAEDDMSEPTTMPCCQYVVSGGVSHPGSRTLVAGDTVSIVLSREFQSPPGHPCTVILIRRAPEGRTRQLIQLNASGQLTDQKQNWMLRNGDELVFPGGEGSNSTRNPTGPPARSGE
jgi:hypothetical protein